MRKALKRIGVVVGGLVGLLALAFLVLYVIGTARWNEIHGKYDVPVEAIAVPADPEAVTRGEHIATIRMCRVCHTETLSGQTDSVPAMVTLTFPNLTRGAGGVGATNTDRDWVRAIRHGVGHDGRGLVLMPVRAFYYLSDEDLGALIAYLKTLKPVDNVMPRSDLEPLGRVMLALGQLPPEIVPDVTRIDHAGPRPVTPKPGVTVEYGEYLAHLCTTCHGANFNGRTFRESGVKYLAPNLTKGGELGSWTEEMFVATLRTGVAANGHRLNDKMPWKYFGQMTDDELKALWLHLRSLPALEQGL